MGAPVAIWMSETAVHIGDPSGRAGEAEIHLRRQGHRRAELHESVDEDRQLAALHLYRDEMGADPERWNGRVDHLPVQVRAVDSVDHADRVRRRVRRAGIGRKPHRDAGNASEAERGSEIAERSRARGGGVGEREREAVGATAASDRRDEAHIQRVRRDRVGPERRARLELLGRRELDGSAPFRVAEPFSVQPPAEGAGTVASSRAGSGEANILHTGVVVAVDDPAVLRARRERSA